MRRGARYVAQQKKRLLTHSPCPFAVGILIATAGFAYLVKRAEEIQREMETEAKAVKARNATAAHLQPGAHGHPPMPRK